MIPVRGKDVFTRKALRAALVEYNQHCDGPWEPAIKRWANGSSVGTFYGKITYTYALCHDIHATHDIYLPGDGKPFDVDSVLAKLLIAEVVEET